MVDVTVADVVAALQYDAATGMFRWRDDNYSYKKGWWHGSLGNEGRYYYFRIKRKLFTAHVLAWVCSYGGWPSSLDHINRDGRDNRLSNLRLANKSGNGANRGKQINNTSGYKGVYKDRYGYWRAKVKKDQQDIYLGRFDDKVAAAKAYDKKAREIFGEYAGLNFPEMV